MLPFKKILCPIDFSDPSYMALEAAEELALQYSAELFVVHVVEKIPVLPALPTNPTIDIPFYWCRNIIRIPSVDARRFKLQMIIIRRRIRI